MLLSEFLAKGTADLSALYPREEAESMLHFLCREMLGTERYTHIIDPKYKVADDMLPALRQALLRLRGGEPLQYVLGYEDFCGHRFNVSPDVLIPRPETQMLVEEAVKIAPPEARILDLCTGSGCIAWSLAMALPSASVTATDISDAALSVASAQPFDIPNRPVFLKADVLAPPPSIGPFDIVLSNPPYIMEREKGAMRGNVLDYEPHLALFVPDDDPLRFYRGVAEWASVLLVPGGKGIVEINEALGEETKGLFEKSGFSKTSLRPDFFGKNRFVIFEK